MTFDEFESFRTKGGNPESALRELSAAGPEVPAELLNRIAQDVVARLRPVSPLPSNRILVALFLGLAVLACAAGTWWQGDAGWLKLSGTHRAIIFCLLGAGMSLTAAVVARQMVPGARRWMPLAAASAAICGLLFASVLLIFPYKESPHFVSIGMRCWGVGVEWSAVAGALFFLVVRRGAWLTPLALGASTGLFAGLVGLTVLEILCPYFDRGHVGVWHFGAALTATLMGAAIAAFGSALSRIFPRPVSL